MLGPVPVTNPRCVLLIRSDNQPPRISDAEKQASQANGKPTRNYTYIGGDISKRTEAAQTESLAEEE